MIAELVCTPILAAVLTVMPGRGAVVSGPEPVGPVADVNLDGLVDYDDVIEHLFLWGPCDAQACLGDLDGDGFVDVLDFLHLLDSLDQLLMVDAHAT